ncbi:MAG: hypothetical protein AAF621_06630 [Pseudomonadota bacterium]
MAERVGSGSSDMPRVYSGKDRKNTSVNIQRHLVRNRQRRSSEGSNGTENAADNPQSSNVNAIGDNANAAVPSNGTESSATQNVTPDGNRGPADGAKTAGTTPNLASTGENTTESNNDTTASATPQKRGWLMTKLLGPKRTPEEEKEHRARVDALKEVIREERAEEKAKEAEGDDIEEGAKKAKENPLGRFSNIAKTFTGSETSEEAGVKIAMMLAGAVATRQMRPQTPNGYISPSAGGQMPPVLIPNMQAGGLPSAGGYQGYAGGPAFSPQFAQHAAQQQAHLPQGNPMFAATAAGVPPIMQAGGLRASPLAVPGGSPLGMMNQPSGMGPAAIPGMVY